MAYSLVVLFLSCIFIVSIPLALAGLPHTITFHSDSPPFSSLIYDPIEQHFLVPFPTSISSVSDAGVLQILNLQSPLHPSAAIALDRRRRRLLAVAPSPQLAAYDLSSSPPHRRLFFSDLPSDDLPIRPSSVTVDTSSGCAYVAAADANVIWRVDVDGKASVLSRSRAFDGGEGLDGIVYLSKGYLLVAQGSTGRLFKVDPEDGTARLVLMGNKIDGLGGLDMRSDGSLVAISSESAWILKSDDGWSEAKIYDRIALGERRLARGLAVRDGRKTYVLHGEEGIEAWKIDEVESEREMGGEWVGALVMVGLGLAVFAYWRFQMGQLVSSMNKKIA